MILKDFLVAAKLKLDEANIDDSMIIIKTIVCKFLNFSKEQLVVNYDFEIDNYNLGLLNSSINKILNGVPLQYVVNNQEFMMMNFYVDENVLIPQPDTEVLVEAVISNFKNKKCKILDLCTGSGAIGVSIAKYIDDAFVIASDISNKAIQVAKLNSEKNLVHKKMQFIQSDLFEKINECDFDAIVSNPPYIKTDVIKNLDVQVQNEPFIALDGGFDGLKFYKNIISQVDKFLKSGGMLFLEIGYDQKEDVMELCKNALIFEDIRCIQDLAGNNRAIIAKKI